MDFSSSFPDDILTWMNGHLPPLPQQSASASINLIRPSPPSQPSLTLSLKISHASHFSLSIASHDDPPTNPLWTSTKIPISDQDSAALLLSNLVKDVLKYSRPNESLHSLNILLSPSDSLKDVFNFAFLTLTFVVCVRKVDLSQSWLPLLIDHLSSPATRQASKILMRHLGSNTEEKWMRSMNLAITNWMSEAKAAAAAVITTPSPLFSYALYTQGLWKVQLHCPVIAADVEQAGSTSPDDRLLFSLNYHQIAAVIQLNYKVDVQEKWIEVAVNIDNIRCDVTKLLPGAQLNKRGAGDCEKHFPSRISLQITPLHQSSVLSVSIAKSTPNPPTDVTVSKGVDVALSPVSLRVSGSARETTTTTLRPWKFEQCAEGGTVCLSWFLHDCGDGREVCSSKPPKLALLRPRSWFRHRYSAATRPFTRRGGVVFAGDEYGESAAAWKVDREPAAAGGRMEWEVKGYIWVTYWPNEHITLYSETRRLEFKEMVCLNLD